MQNIEISSPRKEKEDEQQESRIVVGAKATTIADLIGEFGLFQFSISLLAFIRYVCAAMMTNSGSLLAPDLEFKCKPEASIRGMILLPNESLSLDAFLKDKCQLELKNGTLFECSSWEYEVGRTGFTLTDQFDLVCGRDWLRSSFQSIVTIGVILAAVVWGSFSDRHGRHLTILICFTWSLISGLIAYYAESFIVFALARSLCSFGDIGLAVSLVTIIVETLGNKYREAVCVIAYTGWAFGVLIMPWLMEFFMNYKHLMLFTIVSHLLTLPWILISVRESVRWLLVNGRISEAKEEMDRINRVNKMLEEKKDTCSEKDFDSLKERFIVLAEKRRIEKETKEANWSRSRHICMSIFGGLSMLNRLFSSRELTIVTLTMVWVTFNCELFYMTTILINSDIGDNIKLNYAIGGLMETLASIIAIGLIASVTRKLSIVSTLITISMLSFLLALTHQDPVASIWVLNLTKLGVSTLTSIIYVTTTELFPTNLRQTGFGITSTLGGLGSVISPFVRRELVELIGLTGVLFILVALPLTAAAIIPFFLRETKGVELLDDLDEIKGEKIELKLERKVSKSQTVTTV